VGKRFFTDDDLDAVSCGFRSYSEMGFRIGSDDYNIGDDFPEERIDIRIHCRGRRELFPIGKKPLSGFGFDIAACHQRAVRVTCDCSDVGTRFLA
jgi:hypothetical protein